MRCAPWPAQCSLHGNAENISTHLASVRWLPDQGHNVFLFDYRGYGRSAGKPSLPGLHLDIEAALEAALGIAEVNPERIVVLGQSLGGTVAITALARSAYRHRVRALIVDGAFFQLSRDCTREAGRVVDHLAAEWPLSLTIDNQYEPLESNSRISPVPVLIIHGLVDRVVWPHHGEALYAAARQPKELWLVPEADHIQTLFRVEAQQRLLGYLAAHCDASGGEAGRQAAH